MRQWTTLHKYIWLRAYQIASAVYETVKGAVVNFTTKRSAPLTELTVEFSPVQDLNGYSNPWPAGGGKNKLKILSTSETVSDVTFTVNSDGSVKVDGTASASVAWSLNDVLNQYLENGETYILNGSPANSDPTKWKLRVYNGTSDYIDEGNGVSFTFNGTSSAKKCDIVVYAGTHMDNVVFWPMIRLSSVSDDTFAPYSNICPISGWDGVEIIQSAGNIADGSTILNGAIHGTTGGVSVSNTRLYTSNYIPVKAGTYNIRTYPELANVVRVYANNTESSFISGEGDGGTWHENGRTITFTADRYIRIMFSYNMGAQTAIVPSDLQYLNVSASSTTISINLGSTVYAGYVDAVTGVVTVTHKALNAVTVKNAFTQGSGNVYIGSTTMRSNPDLKDIAFPIDVQNAYCNCLVPMNQSSADVPSFSISSGRILAVNGAEGITDTVENWRSYIDNNDVIFVLKLIDPIPISLTPQTINSLAGDNVMWASTNGDIEVTYRSN